jgi:hypothetical protein
MTDQERKVMQEFEENDKELERIAKYIVEQLDSLKDKALLTGQEITSQRELLQKGMLLIYQ